MAIEETEYPVLVRAKLYPTLPYILSTGQLLEICGGHTSRSSISFNTHVTFCAAFPGNKSRNSSNGHLPSGVL